MWIIDPASTTAKQVLTGTVQAGNIISGVVWTSGTNQTHTAGATIVDYTTATGFDMVTTGVLKHANQDGSLQKSPVITAIGTGGIVTANLANASVTADKLATGAAGASVLTSETTVSTTYTDLTTTTDTVTVTIGANGLALVFLYGFMGNSQASSLSNISFTVSGANTLAASDNLCLSYSTPPSGAGFSGNYGATFLLTALIPGSSTFKMKYRVNANTGTFLSRRIAVLPL